MAPAAVESCQIAQFVGKLLTLGVSIAA